jgi:phosphopentomutase
MSRAFVLLFDSFGIGEAEDAAKFGDQGGDTFGHIAAECAAGRADKAGLRQGPLHLPNLTRLGLLEAYKASTGKEAHGMPQAEKIDGAYGYAVEQSFGKDTPSGHWEIAGVPVLFDWGYFTELTNSFPQKLIDDFIERTGVPGILGNCHASGTVIINELGDEHVKTGKPILYTSADSVLQIACHEEAFGLDRLKEVCEIAREIVDEYNIGRVIARPFVGSNGDYSRTGNRRDYSVLPPAPTLLNKLVDAGGEVIAIGKVADIYAHSGISKEVKADGNIALFDKLLEETAKAPKNSLTFVNFVDFDSKYGHRRDVAGYAHALEELDKRLPEFEDLLKEGDLAVITADHGCDPTFKGTDHTREHIPVLFFGPACQPGAIGRRESFADIGQTLAKNLSLAELAAGEAI